MPGSDARWTVRTTADTATPSPRPPAMSDRLTTAGEALLEWVREPHPALRWWTDATLRLLGATYLLTSAAKWLGWAV